jgi:hypothetical protein
LGVKVSIFHASKVIFLPFKSHSSLKPQYLFDKNYWLKLDVKYKMVHTPTFIGQYIINSSSLGWQLQPGYSMELGVVSNPGYILARNHPYNRGFNEETNIVGEGIWRRGVFECFLKAKMRPYENHEVTLGLDRVDYEFNYSEYQAIDPFTFL